MWSSSNLVWFVKYIDWFTADWWDIKIQILDNYLLGLEKKRENTVAVFKG